MWRDFLRAHGTIVRRLESELLAEQDLPLAFYDVLVQLAEVPDRRLRMTDLAGRVLLSRSGLSRLINRLERDGLVERAPCPGDARGTYAVLTDAGMTRLRAAAPTHLRGIARHMTGHFAADEIEQFGVLLRTLLDGVARSGGEVHGTPQPGTRATPGAEQSA